MTDVGRMSVQELLGKVLADEHADVLRQAVVWLAEQLMEAEVTAAAGAGYGQRSPDRAARRNGYRERAWDTRVGSVACSSLEPTPNALRLTTSGALTRGPVVGLSRRPRKVR
jgi:hypothetical protein